MIQEYTISRDDSIYEAFPDVAMNDEGELICVFLECEHHLKREKVRISMTRSRDGGRTWDKKEAFTERSEESGGLTFNCPRISRLPDGTMVILCDADDERYSTKGKVQYIWRSGDGGKTWGEPQVVPLLGIVPDKYQVLSNGRHMFGIHRDGESGKSQQYACYSDDGGATWQEVLIAADERYNLCEVSIVEVKEGVLVAFMRENSGLGHDCKKAISHDYGSTWEGVYDTNIDGCHRPVVGFYDEGKLFMTYRYAQGGCRWPVQQNLFGAFFDVETALETIRLGQHVRIFPIAYDRNPMSDTGYTGWICNNKKDFYVVNYLLDDAPKAQIKGYCFSLDDVLVSSDTDREVLP